MRCILFPQVYQTTGCTVWIRFPCNYLVPIQTSCGLCGPRYSVSSPSHLTMKRAYVLRYGVSRAQGKSPITLTNSCSSPEPKGDPEERGGKKERKRTDSREIGRQRASKRGHHKAKLYIYIAMIYYSDHISLFHDNCMNNLYDLLVSQLVKLQLNM